MNEKQTIRHYDEAETWQQKIVFCLLVLGRCSGYLALYFIVPAFFLSIAYVLFYSQADPTDFFTYGGSFYTTLGMAVTLYFLRCKAKRQKVRLVTGIPEAIDREILEKSAIAFGFGLCAALALSAVLTLFEKVSFLAPLVGGYTEASLNLYRGYDLIFTILSTVLLAPVVEEVIFRGYILDILLEHFPERTATYIVTIGFALCHVNGLWMVYAAISGYLFCAIALREDGIFYPILCHIGFNFPSAVIVLVTLYVEGATATFQNTFFLFSLATACGGIALYLGRHYARQSEINYTSILTKWRHDT